MQSLKILTSCPWIGRALRCFQGEFVQENPRGKVLVIDDSETNRYVFSSILRQASFSVDEAASGVEGILRVQNLPDVIILDVNLPDMDGYEVCRTLKASRLSRDIPVIQVSATFTSQNDFMNGHRVGADIYLVSPIDPDLLVECVESFVENFK